MISYEDALSMVLHHARFHKPQVTQSLVDPSLVGHVLSDSVTATENIPYFRSSIVDGYAVIGRFADYAFGHALEI